MLSTNAVYDSSVYALPCQVQPSASFSVSHTSFLANIKHIQESVTFRQANAHN